MNERRDLQGLTVQSASAHEAVCPKGGLPRLDGTLEVPFVYRDRRYSVITAYDADAAAVSSAILARTAAVDPVLDWSEFADSLAGEIV